MNKRKKKRTTNKNMTKNKTHLQRRHLYKNTITIPMIMTVLTSTRRTTTTSRTATDCFSLCLTLQSVGEIPPSHRESEVWGSAEV